MTRRKWRWPNIDVIFFSHNKIHIGTGLDAYSIMSINDVYTVCLCPRNRTPCLYGLIAQSFSMFIPRFIVLLLELTEFDALCSVNKIKFSALLFYHLMAVRV